MDIPLLKSFYQLNVKSVEWRLTTDKNFNKFLVLLYIISSAASQTSSFTTTNIPITARDSFLPQIQTQGLIEDDWVLEKTIDPDVYIVGPGDKFAFNLITSGRITDIKLQINPTGEILIPGIGLLSVDGLTVNQTIEKMKTESLKQYENGIVNIVLVDIRKFKIQVIGHLDNPGYYLATPLTRVSNIFSTVIEKEIKGETQLAETTHETLTARGLSQRNILLKRNGINNRVDLERFGMLGDESDNPQIKQGDVIYIPIEKNNVSIYGGIELTGKYEYVKNEILYDLIQLAGGFTKNADSSKITVTRFIDDMERKTINIENNEKIKTFILVPDDHIIVRHKKDFRRQDLVKISGEVKYPGIYSIIPGKTDLRKILNQAGGYSSKADQSKITITSAGISVDKEAERISTIPYPDRTDTELSYLRARIRSVKGGVSLTSSEMVSKAMNFKLETGDAIFIPMYFGEVEIIGGVLFPGRYPFEPRMQTEEYINLAGGMTKSATGDVYVVNAETGVRISSKIINNINNGDIIFIDEKIEYRKWNRFLEVMNVVGQIATILVVIKSFSGS